MNTTNENSQALVRSKSRVSAIWILPLIAALIGIGMVYEQWRNQGIMIAITYDNAEGLEAKKTKVKYRNVDIGTVTNISFTEDGNSVKVGVEIDRNMQQFLRTDTQFWVVRPRIGSQGISGFGTLLSGAYINLEPGTSNEYAELFSGLNTPPLSSPSNDGLKLRLESAGGKSLREGNPVIYRGFEVGVIESTDFDISTRQVSYDVFIRAPYDALVTSNTFFWNSGGLSVSANTKGLKVDFASLESFLSGGVQFDVPEDLPLGEKVTQTRAFKLYPSQSSITEDREYEYIEYVILVDDTVGGLEIGAPVEYRGIRIGRVHRPYLGFHQVNLIDPKEKRIPVVIHVEPSRITQNSNYGKEWFEKQFTQWIREGLAAQLETANYLTGSLKVSLNLHSEIPDELEYFGDYMVIPLAQGGFASLMSKTEALLSKLNSLPVENLLSDANTAVNSMNTAILNANESILGVQSLVSSVEQTLVETRKTMQGLQSDSPIYMKLESNLQELERSLNLMQPLLQEIRNKPSTLIFSDTPPADVEPKGKAQ
ncbi:intermembrane transport protein PqiB [Glaciecola sp. 2405UD65-10]|uniref:intermembrane transport protein PqiB n=1 Tax=Glaciecola sp. 2405UD65-10 TaxID=3397244 RepID=UPI003B59F0D3